MASVDDRVVQMGFDNAAFEQKIATTMGSLDKLKGSLDFANSKRGLDDLSTAGKTFDLGGVTKAIEDVGSHFSTMGIIAISVLKNIADRAVDAGISIVKSLSLDQVLGGFHEYETNMNAIQTVLANTRADNTTLEDVNNALDTLNTYSDQTIYNFSEMARNIGTFTAAGVNLDSSVSAIKGIANLAAVSGSNADQASTAMYQLSQALASGSVKLMDWNSVVNAGMGGKVFQEALFNTGKNLKTIKNVPMKETFKEWTDSGHTFRDSLQDGWVTADVLTQTLQGFTGDLTEAQIKAMGYSDEQSAQIFAMGKTAQEAATKVKTLTQLVSTVKEAIGSGWTKSFQIVFGDFEEAKTVFTGFNDAIGAMVSKSADSRNALLQNWKDLGGRTALLNGIVDTFKGLAGIMSPIKAAFKDIFPPFTVTTLLSITNAFADFAKKLKPTPAVAALLTRTFRGVFSVFSIGIEVVKDLFHFFGDLIDKFNTSNDPNNGILGFTARMGDALYELKKILVDGGGIKEFFQDMTADVLKFVDGISFKNVLDKAQTLVGDVKSAILGMFNISSSDSASSSPGILASVFDRLGERFGWITGLGATLASTWDTIASTFDTVTTKLGTFVQFIQDSFSGLPQTIADALADTDYNQALDTVNTGLFAGIAALIAKFIHGGFGGGGHLLGNISQSFKSLSKTLQAMQTNIKAEALLKIAGAVAVLTASVLILSLINSGALTKSMSAMAVGFGELVGVMKLLDELISGPLTAPKLAILSAGLILIAAAMLLLSVSVKIFSTMSWEDLAKGLSAVGILLGVLAVALKLMTDNNSGIIRTGLGLIAIAVALNIMAGAVKLFSLMDWDTLAKGMSGVAAGLLIMAGSLQLMPSGMISKGIGLIAVAVALTIMAGAVALFATMEWDTLGKGLAGVAASLLILAGAMGLMPNGVMLALQGAGIALIGLGLISMSKAIIALSGLSWGNLAKGLTGIAGTLVILAGAAALMEGSLGGAVATGIMAVAMGQMAKGVKAFASIKWGDLLHGLIGLASTLGVLGLAALVMEPVIPALALLGAALILVGAGFALFGVGANLVATAFAIIATAGTEGIATLAGALDVLITHLPAIIAALADGLIQLAQKIVEALPQLIGGLDKVVKALIQLVIDNIPGLAEAVKTFILSALGVIKDTAPDIIATGLELLLDLLQGISDNIEEITTTVVAIVVKFLDTLAAHANELVTAGLNVLTNFLQGIADNIDDVVTAALDIVASIIEGIGNGTLDLIVAGTTVVDNIIAGLAAAAVSMIGAGADALISFLQGIADNIQKVIDAGFDIIINFINGVADSIRVHAPELRAAGWNLATAIADGITGGLASKAGSVADTAKSLAGRAVDAMVSFWHIGSPSKTFRYLAEMAGEGLAEGFRNNTSAVAEAVALGDQVTSSLQYTMSTIPSYLDGLAEFSPTITPVLDLTAVTSQAKKLGDIIGPNAGVSATLSYDQARAIATSEAARQTDTSTTDPTIGPREVKFEQNNYSPTALSTADIYRRTRNQIAMAKEELAVI